MSVFVNSSSTPRTTISFSRQVVCASRLQISNRPPAFRETELNRYAIFIAEIASRRTGLRGRKLETSLAEDQLPSVRHATLLHRSDSTRGRLRFCGSHAQGALARCPRRKPSRTSGRLA